MDMSIQIDISVYINPLELTILPFLFSRRAVRLKGI
ncbi:TPA: hypothetical protein DCX15_03510 [bacterium]|nr:hypothetical protein [bacterium]